MEASTKIIEFKGTLDFKIISSLITNLDKKRDSFNIEIAAYKKLISLMIECLENIYKYSDHFTDFINYHPQFQPEFHMLRNGKYFLLQTKNPIRLADIDKVKQKIDRINNLDQEQMRIFYRETITNGEFTEKGGAGLGFIEMAKITNQPIEYHFDFLSDDFFNFKLILHMQTF